MIQRFLRPLTALAAAFALLFIALPSEAVSIFVNGTQVDGALMDATLEKCTAVFDSKGDLNLNCPGYNFAVDEEGSAPANSQAEGDVSTTKGARPPQAPAAVPASAKDAAPTQLATPPSLGAKFVLFSSQSENIGAAGFDVDVFINGVIAVRLKNDDIQVVEDVTRFLKKGDNKVTFVARKKPSIRDVPVTPNDFIEIQISEGSVDAATGTLTISAGTGLTYRVTAAERADNTKEMTLKVR